MNNTTGSNSDQEYTDFLERVQQRFLTNLEIGDKLLFKTDAVDLWEVYLSAFKTPEERQHHNCNTCHHFIKNYGGLVTIDANGIAKTALWDAKDAPALYKPAVTALAKAVNAAKVTGVFLSSDKNWGSASVGGWSHLSLRPPATLLYRNRIKTAGQAMAEKREDYGILQRSIADFDLAAATKALDLLRSGTFYRPEIGLPVAEFFRDLLLSIDGMPSSAKSKLKRDNIVWKAVAKSGPGLTHVRSSMIGTLLEDVAAGKSAEECAANWGIKTSASAYQRAQVAPSQGQVDQAEKLVEQLGIEPALHRRYAKLSEVQKLWEGQEYAVKAHKSKGGVFSGIKVKGAVASAAEAVVIGGTTVVTWDKFRRTVLPAAAKMEAFVPKDNSRFAALVTAVNADAPPILQWDNEDARNPFSWYYASGIDAEAKRRVTEAGGMYDNVDLRVTLVWNDRHDLDLNVHAPNGERIYYCNKQGRSGGWLDVDMNISGETLKPVENVRWPLGSAKPGRYSVGVARYNSGYRRDSGATSPFTLEIASRNCVYHFTGVNKRSTGSSPEEFVSFVLNADGSINSVKLLNGALLTSRDLSETWNVGSGDFTPVTAVVESPNTWAGKTTTHGRHVFFTLDGCQDTTEGVGRGFFAEMLKSELRPIRATLEAFTADAVIEGADEADACGIGMSDQSPWNLVVRVTSTTGKVQTYKIDRWD